MKKRIYCFSMICIFLCVSLTGCIGNNKPDNNYTFGQYTVAYGDVNLHLDSTCKSDFGKDNPDGSTRKIIGGAAHCAYIEKPYYHDFHNTLIKFLSSR